MWLNNTESSNKLSAAENGHSLAQIISQSVAGSLFCLAVQIPPIGLGMAVGVCTGLFTHLLLGFYIHSRMEDEIQRWQHDIYFSKSAPDTSQIDELQPYSAIVSRKGEGFEFVYKTTDDDVLRWTVSNPKSQVFKECENVMASMKLSGNNIQKVATADNPGLVRAFSVEDSAVHKHYAHKSFNGANLTSTVSFVMLALLAKPVGMSIAVQLSPPAALLCIGGAFAVAGVASSVLGAHAFFHKQKVVEAKPTKTVAATVVATPTKTV